LSKGNFTSIVSNALRVSREKGPAGLQEWIEADFSKRSFLLKIRALEIYAADKGGVEYTWRSIEEMKNSMCYAKEFAKTRT
jgi:hypothetical protein